MDDLNDIAGLHSAGATVRHHSPFENLPPYKNENDLSADFIKTWAAPYYMEIASSDNLNWVDRIKEIKPEITKDICLNLLGDFNWRTRLVGSYFSAVKDYRELVDIIGGHLLKSEVCCVGHIYALTLAFFNETNCILYLNKYLDYYLTKPSLYFEQKFVMEALLFLDKENKTNHFNKHLDKWKKFKEERQQIERQQEKHIEEILAQQGDVVSSDDFLQLEDDEQSEKTFSTKFFEEQIAILRDLKKYSR